MAVRAQLSNIAHQTASLIHVYTIFTTSLMHFFTWDFFALVFFGFHRYVYFLLNCAYTAIYYTSTTTTTTTTTAAAAAAATATTTTTI